MNFIIEVFYPEILYLSPVFISTMLNILLWKL